MVQIGIILEEHDHAETWDPWSAADVGRKMPFAYTFSDMMPPLSTKLA